MTNRSKSYRSFKAWLKINGSRFTSKPYIANVKKNSFDIYFKGCGSHICIHVSKDLSFSPYVYCLEYSDGDFVEEWDIGLRRDVFGRFYCSYCIEKKFYKSMEVMLIEHCYEPMLDWVNRVLISENYIICYRGRVKFSTQEEVSLMSSSDRHFKSISFRKLKAPL